MTPTNDQLNRIESKLDKLSDSVSKIHTRVALVEQHQEDTDMRMQKSSTRIWSFVTATSGRLIAGAIGALIVLFAKKGGH